MPQLSLPSEGDSHITFFEKKEVRRIIYGGEWWFSVKDVLECVAEVDDGDELLLKIRNIDKGLDASWPKMIKVLPFSSASGNEDAVCIDIEGIFRLIQSITSENVEPFKKWLAKVGFERLEETNNPELAIKRAITLYRAKGYSDDWIEARIGNKISRELLTREWSERGVISSAALLTDAISIETFGLHVEEHRRLKGLRSKSQNLRDNMTPLEVTLTTLGEQATREIIKSTNPEGKNAHLEVAKKGGRIAGNARKSIEEELGKSVLSSSNHLTKKQIKNNENYDEKIRLSKILPPREDDEGIDRDELLDVD